MFEKRNCVCFRMKCQTLHYWDLEEEKEPWWVCWDPWFNSRKLPVFWTVYFI